MVIEESMQIEEGGLIIRKPNTLIVAFSFQVFHNLQTSILASINVKF